MKLKGFLAVGAILATSACGASSTQGGKDPTLQAESEYDVAKDLWLRQNRPREALSHALDAVELDDENADAAHLVALIYLRFCERADTGSTSKLGECRLEEAEKHARIALEAKPDYREARNTLGLTLIHQKRYADAVEVLKPLAEDMLYQTPEIAWGNLGWAFLEQKKLRSAVDALERSVAAEPGFCVGWYRLGLARMRLRNPNGAEEAFTEALTRDPRCAGLQAAYLKRAQVRRKLGQSAAAREDLEQCVDLDRRTREGKECAAALANLRYSRAAEWSPSENTFANSAKRKE